MPHDKHKRDREHIVGPEYYDPDAKMEFMDSHGIDISVLSLPNPWLDFLPEEDKPIEAQKLNEEMSELCQRSHGRFYGFGVVPLPDVAAACEEVDRIRKLPGMRGVVMGTNAGGRCVCRGLFKLGSW